MLRREVPDVALALLTLSGRMYNLTFIPGDSLSLLIVTGVYRFAPKRVAFRNDYCLSCRAPRRAVQVRTFDAFHIFWIPLLPLWFHRRWYCLLCGRRPHVHPGTRRGFKWAGLVVLILFALAVWVTPVERDSAPFLWTGRALLPLSVFLLAWHLVRTKGDPALKELLAMVPAADDTICPFCGASLLIMSSQSSCPACGVLRL